MSASESENVEVEMEMRKEETNQPGLRGEGISETPGVK